MGVSKYGGVGDVQRRRVRNGPGIRPGLRGHRDIDGPDGIGGIAIRALGRRRGDGKLEIGIRVRRRTIYL